MIRLASDRIPSPFSVFFCQPAACKLRCGGWFFTLSLSKLFSTIAACLLYILYLILPCRCIAKRMQTSMGFAMPLQCNRIAETMQSRCKTFLFCNATALQWHCNCMTAKRRDTKGFRVFEFSKIGFFQKFFSRFASDFFLRKIFLPLESSSKNLMLRNYDGVFLWTFFVDRFIFLCKAIFLHKPCIAVALQNECCFALQRHCNRNAKGDAKPMQNHPSLQCNCIVTAMQWHCKSDANQQCNGNATALQK